MSRSSVRLLACSVLIGLAAAGGVQAQTPAAASASLPDFTGIVQQNAAAVVHVEAKYNGRRQPRAMPGVPGGDDQAEILRRFDAAEDGIDDVDHLVAVIGRFHQNAPITLAILPFSVSALKGLTM